MTETRLFLASVLVVLTASAPVHAAKIKCWTNSDGIRECGNIVPPEYAQQGHEEVNKQGVTTKIHERAKTDEELAEERRIAEEKAEKERLQKEQYKRDRALLQTFSSEDEIVMTRDGKLTAIDTELRLTRASMKNTRERLAEYEKRAAALERSGKPLDDKLKKDLETAKMQIKDYEIFITNKEREKSSIQAQFDHDMDRFKKLKTGQVQLPPTEETTSKTDDKNKKKNAKKTSNK